MNAVATAEIANIVIDAKCDGDVGWIWSERDEMKCTVVVVLTAQFSAVHLQRDVSSAIPDNRSPERRGHEALVDHFDLKVCH
jgi:hypothetical protein